MKKLTIIVPVYNEEPTVQSIMETLASIATSDTQIVYVDDGSRDRSLEILNAHKRSEDLVITKPNGGKGSAIQKGLEHADGQFTVIQDADLEYDPHEIQLLLAKAEILPDAAIFGSRFLQNNPNIYRRFLLGNKVLTGFINLLFLSHITDSYTCYKLLPTNVFRSLNLHSNGFELEAEITCKCLRRKIEIIEVPISYHPRKIEEGKKINWKDAVRGMLKMVQMRFGRI